MAPGQRSSPGRRSGCQKEFRWACTNQAAATVMGRIYHHVSGHESSTGTRLLLIIVLAVLVHVTVKLIRHVSEWLINKSHAQKSPLGFVTQQPKFITLIQLIANGVTFVIYFFAMGLVLQELGVNLTALSGQRLHHRAGHQLRLAGTGAGRGYRPDADFFGHDGRGRHGGDRRHDRGRGAGGGNRPAVHHSSAIFTIRWYSFPTAPSPT